MNRKRSERHKEEIKRFGHTKIIRLNTAGIKKIPV